MPRSKKPPPRRSAKRKAKAAAKAKSKGWRSKGRKLTPEAKADLDELRTALKAPAPPAPLVEEGDYFFDEAAANKAIRFFEKYIRHWKAEWAGKPFLLEPWQADITRRIFGWKRKKDGTRRYRKVFIFVPRKNGKTTWVAAMALLLLLADGEQGGEIYSAAKDQKQAKIVFADAKAMVGASEELTAKTEVYTTTIVAPGTMSKYEVVSSDAGGKHGYNASGIVLDELHAIQDRDLVAALTTSTASRRQPLQFFMSTAGHDRHSLCFETYEYACKVRDGIVDDPSFLPVIYEAGPDDDWTSPETWKKANPNYGISVKVEYLEEQCREAKEKPAYENIFRQLHLNQWTENEIRAFPIAKWDASGRAHDDCEDEDCRSRKHLVEVFEEQLVGQVCWAALDLSSTQDLTTIVYVFPQPDGTQLHFARCWVPEEIMELRTRRDRVPYATWVKAGLVASTSGDIIDYDFILKQIVEDGAKWKIQEIAFDPLNAHKLVKELGDEGFNCVEFPQNFKHMAPATKDFLTRIYQRQIKHGGNPVYRWNANNLLLKKDENGNLRPDKKRAREKIDLMVAGMMASDRASKQIPPENGPSKYDEESAGLLTL